MRYLRYVLDLIRAVFREFVDDGCMNTAAALTYTSLFAVVPFMTVTYAVFSVLPAFQHVGADIESFVFDNFVPASSVAIQEQLHQFSEQARGLTLAGVGILVVTAYLTLVNIERAFNRIWRVEKPRTGTTRLLVYWTMMTFGPPMLAVTVLVSSYLLSLPLVSDVDVYDVRGSLLGYLPWLSSGLAFFLLFWAMPNCRVPWRHALLGALITMVAFQTMIAAFRWMVASSDMRVIYGTFAAVPLFLSWLYLCWCLVLAGAVLVKQMGHPISLGTARCPPLELALRILAKLHAAHRRGGSVGHEVLVSTGARVDASSWQAVMRELKAAGLVVECEDGQFVLGRDLGRVTLLDLYLKLPQQVAAVSMPDMPRVEARLQAMLSEAARHLEVSLEEVLDDADEDDTGSADGAAAHERVRAL